MVDRIIPIQTEGAKAPATHPFMAPPEGNVGERRLSLRYDLVVPVTLTILAPHQPDHPVHLQLQAYTVNLSRRGVKLLLHHVSLALYNQLLRSVRSVRIQFDNPFTYEAIEVQGNVVWYDYHHETASNLARCYLGVTLDQRMTNPLDDEYARLLEMLDRLSKGPEAEYRIPA